MKNIASLAIGVIVVIVIVLVGYWFWVPDVGALRTWNEFLELPTMRCQIGDSSVQGLSGVMYVGNGRLRADYKVEGDGIVSTFHTVVYEDGTTYTWADHLNFSERSVLNLGNNSTEANLFTISRCKRVWNVDPKIFVIPLGREFKDRVIVETSQEAMIEDTVSSE